jgi:hypothetical protein
MLVLYTKNLTDALGGATPSGLSSVDNLRTHVVRDRPVTEPEKGKLTGNRQSFMKALSLGLRRLLIDTLLGYKQRSLSSIFVARGE